MSNKEQKNPSSDNPVNEPFYVRLAMLVGRVLPRKIGLGLASLIGTLLGGLNRNPMVRAIRANQSVIHQQQLSKKDLNRLPKEVFRSAAKCIFDYFHFLPRPDELLKIVHFTPESEAAFNRINNNQPCVIVCPHLSNFDLMGYALALKGVIVQVLSFPNPSASYQAQNKIRESTGMIVTPMDLEAFRQARKRLKNGGSILTGLDRPLDNARLEKYQPTFFGKPTNLPVTYIRMAKEAGAPVYIMAAASQPDGTYALLCSSPFWMESADDLETEILMNANKILKEAEDLIIHHSRQWTMFYPIWPEFLGV